MSFFEDSRGVIYPIARIHSIRERYVGPGEKKQYYSHTVTFEDGEHVEIPESEVETIRRVAAGPAIPAAPGTKLLTNYGEPGDLTFTDTIIAWRPSPYGNLIPVTIEWEQPEITPVHAILHPDGKLADCEGRNWQSIAEWEAHRLKEHAAEVARASSEAA